MSLLNRCAAHSKLEKLVQEIKKVAILGTGALGAFGEAVNTHLSQRVQRVQTALDRAGIACETPTDMIRTMRWKLMVNVGMNQASAVMRAPYGVFQSSPHAQALMKALMREVIALAKSIGVNLNKIAMMSNETRPFESLFDLR